MKLPQRRNVRARRRAVARGAGRFRGGQERSPAVASGSGCSGRPPAGQLLPWPCSRLIRQSSALRHYTVCRSCCGRLRPEVGDDRHPGAQRACNIEPAAEADSWVFVEDLEIIFVEGHSQDAPGRRSSGGRRLSASPYQGGARAGEGKADAVFAGFEVARGDVVMIDADLTMPPEELLKSLGSDQSGEGRIINGSRLDLSDGAGGYDVSTRSPTRRSAAVHPGRLSQRFTDTLCGTKALTRSDYARLKAGSKGFRRFDRSGDFALIFGASSSASRRSRC